jgi:hypothetical protein
MLIYNYLKQTFGTIFTNSKILQVSKQKINTGTNYQF